MSEKIFSGDSSKAFWLAINQSKDKDLLYDYGCKAQEMETSHDALLEACENFREWWANHFEDFDKNINSELLCLDNDCEAAIAAGKEQGK